MRLRLFLIVLFVVLAVVAEARQSFKGDFSSVILELPDCGCETQDHRGILLVSANVVVSEVLQKPHGIWQWISAVLL